MIFKRFQLVNNSTGEVLMPTRPATTIATVAEINGYKTAF
jgi:hypothetical protein